jgi:hypothetical protein
MCPFSGNVFLKRRDEGSPSQLMAMMMSEKRCRWIMYVQSAT